MIPILMALFALGGTTYGMAEETLAFYLLLIPVMIAAGYDALVAVGGDPAWGGHGRPWLDHQRVFDRHRLGCCGRHLCRRSDPAADDPGSLLDGHGGLRHALCRTGEGRPVEVAGLRPQGHERGALPETRPPPRLTFTGLHKIVLVLFALTFAVMIWGVSTGGWWMAADEFASSLPPPSSSASLPGWARASWSKASSVARATFWVLPSSSGWRAASWW